MENTIIRETTDTLKRLSPKNQAYFMQLVRVAEVAENGVKNELSKQVLKPSVNVPNLIK